MAMRAELGDFLEARGHRVFTRPPPLAEALARASHVVAQAEPRLATAAFAVGRPLLLTVGDEESWQLARTLKARRVADSLEPQADAARVRATLDRFLSEAGLVEDANEGARLLAAQHTSETASALLEAIERALSSAPTAAQARSAAGAN